MLSFFLEFRIFIYFIPNFFR